MFILQKLISTLIFYLIFGSLFFLSGVSSVVWLLTQHPDQACNIAKSKTLIEHLTDDK